MQRSLIQSKHFVVACAMSMLALVVRSARADVIGYWTFEEYAPGDTLNHRDRLRDTSGNGRDAFASDGSLVTDNNRQSDGNGASVTGDQGGFPNNTPNVVPGSGLFGNTTALEFRGDDEDVMVFRDGFDDFNDGGPAAGADINFGPDDSFTIEAVVRTPGDVDTGAGSDRGAIVAKDVAGDQQSWWTRFQDGNRVAGFVDDSDDHSGSSGDNQVVQATRVFDQNRWFHIAFVRDADNDELRLYLEDLEDGDGFTHDGPDATGPDNTVDFLSNLNDIRIGGFNNDSAGASQLEGAVDVVRISSGALEQTQFLPEPSSFVLLGIALCALLSRRRLIRE